MHGAGWGWWLLTSVGMVAFWAALIYLVVWLVRGAAPWRPQERPEPPADETALEVLQRRLAAGEITVSEYEELRGLLERDPRPPAVPSSQAA